MCVCVRERGREWRRREEEMKEGKKGGREKKKAHSSFPDVVYYVWEWQSCRNIWNSSSASAPPEKRWFLDVNLTWGHSISLPKGTAGFSNLLWQMREFRDLRESFHCNVNVGVLRTLPIQISTSRTCSREDSDWGKPAHILGFMHTLERNNKSSRSFETLVS